MSSIGFRSISLSLMQMVMVPIGQDKSGEARSRHLRRGRKMPARFDSKVAYNRDCSGGLTHSPTYLLLPHGASFSQNVLSIAKRKREANNSSAPCRCTE